MNLDTLQEFRYEVCAVLTGRLMPPFHCRDIEKQAHPTNRGFFDSNPIFLNEKNGHNMPLYSTAYHGSIIWKNQKHQIVLLTGGRQKKKPVHKLYGAR